MEYNAEQEDIGGRVGRGVSRDRIETTGNHQIKYFLKSCGLDTWRLQRYYSTTVQRT
jgi:hypothetical protein